MLFLKSPGKTNTSGYFQDYLTSLLAKKRKLVKLELDLVDRVRVDWQRTLDSDMTSRFRAENSIINCYQLAGLNPPQIAWIDHPLNVVKILLDCPYLCDVSELFIREVWQSELEIQKSIDYRSIKYVLDRIDPQYTIETSIGDIQLGSLAERLNENVMDRIDNIYSDLTGQTVPIPFQNFQIGYLGYFDYFLKIGLNIPQMQPTIDLAKSCGWCWTFENLAILTPKPSQIKIDRSGQIVGIIYNNANILNVLRYLSSTPEIEGA